MAYASTGDRPLFITTSLLLILGLVMVFSASSVVASSKHGMTSYYFVRQLSYAGVGYLLMLMLMNLDYHVWNRDRVIKFLTFAGIAGLLVVFTQPEINGARRWLLIGSMSFQPSEMAKVVLLVFLAAYLHKHEAELNDPRNRLLPCLLVIGVYVGLIGIEPDLGGALCLGLIAMILLFLAGLRWRYLFGFALMAAPVFYFAVVRVPFRWERVKAFLDPSHDPLGSSWQISQSLTAIGSGGLFGLGLGASKQKLFFLPEAHSDFIFAVIGEELGLLGTLFLATAFMIFFFRGLKISYKAPDRFGFYLGMGITLMIAVQALVNISMVLALMPTKGITLPFISQGGSSLMMNLMATGILLNISHYGEQT